MNISYNWLKRYLKTDLSAEEMATILTDIGLEVESFEKIESIRGIRCDRVLEGLGKKKLVAEVGRSDAVGRPILYGTTDEFLKQFGFSTLKELPDIVDIEGALDEENGENDMLYSQQISIDLSQAEPDRTDK